MVGHPQGTRLVSAGGATRRIPCWYWPSPPGSVLPTTVESSSDPRRPGGTAALLPHSCSGEPLSSPLGADDRAWRQAPRGPPPSLSSAAQIVPHSLGSPRRPGYAKLGRPEPP